jgi:hypothetical protein
VKAGSNTITTQWLGEIPVHCVPVPSPPHMRVACANLQMSFH